MAQPHDRPANRLARETSPYLLQHQHNPVDWYPWGPEAFARARAEDRPIFLSVGYSACHWCHVMERESFEDDAIAARMNEHFVNIKVDREERPDVDQIYMAAVQAMTGHGGWPMSVFLTPDGRPFYGGTYFPPLDKHGMPGFPRILDAVAEAWRNRRDEIQAGATQLTEELKSMGRLRPDRGALDASLLDNAFRRLAQSFDARHGGFGDAPKFPHPMDIRVLLRQYDRTGDAEALRMARLTLERMARGGIYDHLGGGFARYSTDARWLVPHFEKMLYDNALLASAYVEAYQVTHDEFFARVARETMDYVLERMTDPEGGVYATEDADSEGVEGKYYVWSLDEVQRVLGPKRAKAFASVYDISAQGNWEHANILNLPKPVEQAAAALNRDPAELARDLAEDRAKLRAVREARVPPGKDTKVLVAWNGLMIAAWAASSRALKDERYLDAARRAAGFILERMRAPDGKLLHGYKDGQARFNAYLDDYACLIDGLTRLFEACGEARWLDAALDLARIMLDEFLDPDEGGFFYTGKGHEALIVRSKEMTDDATPSGNFMAATVLLRLSALTGREEFEHTAAATLRAARPVLAQFPTAAGQGLIALDFLLGPRREIAAVSGDDTAEFRAVLEALGQRFLPRAVIAPRPPQGGFDEAAAAERLPLLAGRPARDGRTTLYVCEHFACRAPVLGVAGVEQAFPGAGATATA
jgi:uncharacterized protein YyaL (SSP411 family)